MHMEHIHASFAHLIRPGRLDIFGNCTAQGLQGVPAELRSVQDATRHLGGDQEHAACLDVHADAFYGIL